MSDDPVVQEVAVKTKLAPEQEKEDRRLNESSRRRHAAWVTGAVATLTFSYLSCVAKGIVPEPNRLKGADIALGLIAIFFVLAVIYPEALARLSLIKLPLGIEVKLDKLEEKQDDQEAILMAFFRIISSQLLVDQKYYLRALARGAAKDWDVTQDLKNRLWQLKEFGLIEECGGQRIGDMFINTKVEVGQFVRLTPNGTKFLVALNKIESSA